MSCCLRRPLAVEKYSKSNPVENALPSPVDHQAGLACGVLYGVQRRVHFCNEIR